MQKETQEEIPVGAGKADDSEELQAAKGQVKVREKERKRAGNSTDKLQNATNKNNKVKSVRSKRTDRQDIVRDDPVKKSTSEVSSAAAEEEEQTKKESEAATKKPSKSSKTPRGPQMKELNSQPSLQAGRGRRKPPGATRAAASPQKNRSQAKAGDAHAAPSRGRKQVAVATGDAEEEAQNAGLRRSRRIASRRWIRQCPAEFLLLCCVTCFVYH